MVCVDTAWMALTYAGRIFAIVQTDGSGYSDDAFVASVNTDGIE